STVSVPATIDSTGSTDVTNQLNSFFASVPDGSTISFPRQARYRVDGTLLVQDRNNLTFEGNGATTLSRNHAAGSRPMWLLRGGSNLVLQNLSIVGANPVAGIQPGSYQPDHEH